DPDALPHCYVRRHPPCSALFPTRRSSDLPSSDSTSSQVRPAARMNLRSSRRRSDGLDWARARHSFSAPIIVMFSVTVPVLPWRRSEEHTSELQSRENLVCRLLLEKKKLSR